ncbi:hypothetical protein VTK56DRAFT_7105 [Thermocarpiscus australiensis]
MASSGRSGGVPLSAAIKQPTPERSDRFLPGARRSAPPPQPDSSIFPIPRQFRESTPGTSPHRKRQRINGDRFIPARSGRDWQSGFRLLEPPTPATPPPPRRGRGGRRGGTPQRQLSQRTQQANTVYANVLRAELFEDTVPQVPDDTILPGHGYGSRELTPPSAGEPFIPPTVTPSTPQKNLFTYVSPRNYNHPTPSRTPQSRHGLIPDSDAYTTSPLRYTTQQMLLAPRRVPRTIAKRPYKVLDAPGLADDFYLNLVDWGNTNLLGVGLGSSVYMYNTLTEETTKLCTLENDRVTSVQWIQKGSHIAIGTRRGLVQIWDAEKSKRLRTMTGHTARVGALAWNAHILTSGSRDRLIYHRDVRAPDQWLKKLVGHKQEVCGLKWNCELGQLASGSNDNNVIIWEDLVEKPLHIFPFHQAAVKALAWSPHHRGMLASGGGTADRKIIFWDTVRGDMRNQIDAGSQVCNLAWSKNSNEIVSTHGYSQNNLIVWKHPQMTQIASLTGHTHRVLFLAMSPDGKDVLTGAGDETLRFWEVFKPKPKIRMESSDGIGIPVIR